MSLADLVANRGRPEVDEALMVARQLADVLDYLHGENVLYRDLSLGNVLVDERWRTTLIDFGSSEYGIEPLPAPGYIADPLARSAP